MNILTPSQASALYYAFQALSGKFDGFSTSHVNEITKAIVAATVTAEGAVLVSFRSNDTGCGMKVERQQSFSDLTAFARAHKIAYLL